MALMSRVAGPQGGMAISARHQLLSDAWTTDVAHLERAISHFNTVADVSNACDVVLFEMAGDRHLHCNVIHRLPTRTVSGWVGPGHVRSGWVHNRRFGEATQTEMVRQIREMVFAAPL